MEKENSFKELVHHVCSRPGMYVPNGNFYAVCSLIMGYTMGNRETPLSGDNWRDFNSYVCIKFGFPTKYILDFVLKTCANNDKEAIKLFEESIYEFIELKAYKTTEEIFEFALTKFRNEEGETEKIFRTFNKALLFGDEQIIKPLIKEHERQNLLWEGAYPDGIRESLLQMSDAQPKKKIYESSDKTKVKIYSADFPFPFEMELLNGLWKIDASPLIALWASQKDKSLLS